jgi:hypothetical protein
LIEGLEEGGAERELSKLVLDVVEGEAVGDGNARDEEATELRQRPNDD